MTIDGEAVSSEEATAGIGRLRQAIHPFAGHPMAQRRWAQMSYIQRSAEMLEAEGGQVDAYVAAGAATEEEGQLIKEVLEAFEAVKASRDDLFYEEVLAPREFLWTNAFGEDEWVDLRAKARQTFGVLSNEKGALIER
ncbi:MAG TPA: hypothetical protein VGI73_04085 [Solirubrobacterales bacterium]|jgi:hypothetical protein